MKSLITPSRLMISFCFKGKNLYLQQFLLKMERGKDNIPKIKEYILWAQNQLQQANGFSGIRVDFDVDPN
jgi:hypothetical protein